MKHIMQHADSPTWCIHCGTFDIYCATTPCVDEQQGRWDASTEENRARMFSRVYGFGEGEG